MIFITSLSVLYDMYLRLIFHYIFLFQIIKQMNTLNQGGYSYNESNVQNSLNYNTQQESNSRMNRSFVDNKPMIQGLVRSVLKV